MLEWSPTVSGLHLGQLVEISAPRSAGRGTSEALDGQQGQLVDYVPDAKELVVVLLESGAVVRVDPECVVPAAIETSGADGFDIVLGPRTSRSALGETMAGCLNQKGFCVLRTVQRAEELAQCFDHLREADAQGQFSRFAREVEEGYLGKSGRARVMWYDPGSTGLPEDRLVAEVDAGMTALAEILQLHSEDAAGAPIAERTPSLVCLSMTDSEEAVFENPGVTDRMVEEYYSTWCRSVFRIIHFLGPAKGKAVLTPKVDSPVSDLEPVYEVAASANTVLVIREDTHSYTYDEPEGGRACWLQSFLMKESPQWSLGELEGDAEIFELARGEGPPPPSGDANNLVATVAMSLQACGGMSNHHKEWCTYLAGTDAQLEMPMSRFDYQPYYDPDVDGNRGTATYVKHFSVQEGTEMFDNKTFEISNIESAAMDPIGRQVLEVGYLSIAQLGLTKKYCSTNPVHASVSVGNDKQEWLNMAEAPKGTNNQLAILANRFSYVFNLKGGSYVMDTACSSSLIAAHMAKMNLLERRWDPLEWHLGLGAGLTLTVFCMIGNCAAHMLSPSGRCLTFNATANGYNRGDGTSAMVIKAGPCDTERIAFFRGSQVGQDGRSASMAAPNGPAQEKCIWGAIREAQMNPPESTVWECHGTGTSLGDPIEVGAVRRVQIKMRRTEPLLVATSKSNCGHLEGSAAQLAMNKCIMQVIMSVCAPTIHLKALNPHLDHSAFDAIFVSEHSPFKYKQGHCQVSSFGVGGTNGHAVFWGEKERPAADTQEEFLAKLRRETASFVVVNGPDPADWENHGMSYDPKPGEKYRVTYSKDPLTQDGTFHYEREPDEVGSIEFYCTTGNHNDWGEDRMMEGDVPGLFYQECEIPESGVLTFRILAEGDQTQPIGPRHTTSSKTEVIVGPQADLDTSWNVAGKPGASVRIEFMAPASAAAEGLRFVTWFLT